MVLLTIMILLEPFEILSWASDMKLGVSGFRQLSDILAILVASAFGGR
jgi:hypothetical protein